MGNSESSSDNDDNNNNKNKKDEGSASSALKIGAAVAGTALLAFGAYSLASSSSQNSESSDSVNGNNGQRRATQKHDVKFQADSSFCQNPRNQISYSDSESSDSDNGDNDRWRATQMPSVQLEGAGRNYCQNPRNPVSYGGYTKEHSAPRIIKIMSYNVWSLENEDFQINKRMEAIGGLIKQHSPDIIFLQEMAPSIYGVFKSCDWWQLYEFSVPPEKATSKYFCMQMSKLPVEKFYTESFENSTTGRGLCVAQIDAGAKRKLIAATCHLKRPDDSHTNSEERMSQANKALSSLSKYYNVVFGGDMNWNESSDGLFPLFGEWHDAWSVLRPGEDGYTYDTVSNPMLKHTGYLQRRLDRFICKLKDYKVKKIDMIGTEAIPGIFYPHNGQRLPILPSDHYGLILTISLKQIT